MGSPTICTQGRRSWVNPLGGDAMR